MVLTKDNLCFIRAVPVKEYRIPIKAKKQITMPRLFNGKSVFAPLLRVHYAADTGEDAIAWAVKNPEKWKAAIEEVIQ